MELPAVRVLVVGDSGVGKTTLLRALCQDTSNTCDATHRWTIGCDVHVLFHPFRHHQEYCIEFIDVGGHVNYEISRQMFYEDVQGIIFMYDLSNTRSLEHLRQWIR